jgi:hypothetical protein
MTMRVLVVCAVITSAACSSQAALTQQIEARQLASDLQVQFLVAVDASNRAVMTDADEDAAVAVREAEQAARVVQRYSGELRKALTALGYSDELERLDRFVTRFAEFQKLDAEILPLAVENTNAKAQRMAFGEAAEAGHAFLTAVDDVIKSTPGMASRLQPLATRAMVAVLEIQILQPPHIAEPSDPAMTRIEQRMMVSQDAARGALMQMQALLPPASRPRLQAATVALDKFIAINKEIITLSRRNSDVRSLALTLGQKRMVTAECDDHLRALQAALGKHSFGGTR